MSFGYILFHQEVPHDFIRCSGNDPYDINRVKNFQIAMHEWFPELGIPATWCLLLADIMGPDFLTIQTQDEEAREKRGGLLGIPLLFLLGRIQ